MSMKRRSTNFALLSLAFLMASFGPIHAPFAATPSPGPPPPSLYIKSRSVGRPHHGRARTGGWLGNRAPNRSRYFRGSSAGSFSGLIDLAATRFGGLG